MKRDQPQVFTEALVQQAERMITNEKNFYRRDAVAGWKLKPVVAARSTSAMGRVGGVESKRSRLPAKAGFHFDETQTQVKVHTRTETPLDDEPTHTLVLSREPSPVATSAQKPWKAPGSKRQNRRAVTAVPSPLFNADVSSSNSPSRLESPAPLASASYSLATSDGMGSMSMLRNSSKVSDGARVPRPSSLPSDDPVESADFLLWRQQNAFSTTPEPPTGPNWGAARGRLGARGGGPQAAVTAKPLQATTLLERPARERRKLPLEGLTPSGMTAMTARPPSWLAPMGPVAKIKNLYERPVLAALGPELYLKHVRESQRELEAAVAQQPMELQQLRRPATRIRAKGLKASRPEGRRALEA